jgi:hypothetical protein
MLTRKNLILLNLILLTSIIKCTDCSAQKIPPFRYPDGLNKKSQKAFKEQFRKGHLLYLNNCAKCHGPNDSLPSLPEFSDSQFFNYQLRASSEHIETFRDQLVRENELTQIILFLQFLDHRKNP